MLRCKSLLHDMSLGSTNFQNGRIRNNNQNGNVRSTSNGSVARATVKHKTKDIRVDYSTVQQTNVTENPEGIIYVYCSPKFKNTCAKLWNFVLLLYFVSMPIGVFLLHKETENNFDKLVALERQLTDYQRLALPHKSSSKVANRSRRSVRKNITHKIQRQSGSLDQLNSYFENYYKILPTTEKELKTGLQSLQENLKKIEVR